MVFIRKAGLSDFPIIIEIIRTSASKEELEGFIPPKSLERRIAGTPPKFLEKIRKDYERKKHDIIVAEKDGNLVGFAYCRYEIDDIEIEEMDVRRERQQQGIGRALVRCIEKITRERGVKYIKTGTSINKAGKPWKAYGFWIRMGFIETGKRTGSNGLTYIELVKPL